jgi:hypothetical protein
MGSALDYGAKVTTREAPMKVSDLQHHELFIAQADESLDVAADRMNWHQSAPFRFSRVSTWSASSPSGT